MNTLSSRRLVLASLACLAFLVFEGVASPTFAACNDGDVQHPDSTICGGVFENGFTWVSFGTSTEGAFGEPASEGYIIIEDDGANTPICVLDGNKITGTGSAITDGTAVSAITFDATNELACQGTKGASGSWYPFEDSGGGVWAVKIPTDRTVPADYTLVACNSTDTFSTSSGCAAAVSGPEINVKDDAASSVADGGTLTISPNPVEGTSTTEVLTIENTGTETLTLGTPTTSNTTNVTITSAVLASSTVAADGSTTLTITYTPTNSGAFSFDLDIPSDDSDEATYDIALSGTASASVPEINVKDDAASSVADGGTLTISPNPVGGTSTTEVLTIENTGTATLTLGTPTTSNTSNASVTSAVLAASTVAADGSTTLTITYTPTSNGSFSFDLDIPSDDSDEATYDIALSGTASANPEINVKDDKGTSVADGGTLAVSPNPVGGSSTTEILTIENTGSTTLTLGTPTTSNTSNATVASAVLGTGTVAAGGSTTLTITYTPTDIGAFSFDLDIPSDDGDEANYDIALNGTADTSGPSVSDAAIRVQQAGSQVTNSTFAKSIARTVQNRFHQARGGRGRVFSNNLSQFSNQTAMHGATPRLSSEVNAPVGSLGEAFGQIGERLGFYDGDGWTSFTTDDLFMAAGNFSSFQSLAQVEQLEADFGAGLSSFGRTSPFGALLPGDGLDFYGSYSGGHYYRKGLDAYEGFSSELTVGLDGFFTDDLFAGLALAHEASRVDFTGTSQGRLVKEGVRTDVYGAWQAFEAISLEGLASYGRFGNKVTTLGETGKPDSERWIISGRANLDLNWDRYLVTPNASLTYITETYDAYATDLGTAVASQKIDSGSWSTGVRVQGFEPIIYGLNGYLSANAEGTWETSNTTSLSNGYGTNAMTGAWEAGLTGSMAGFADGTWLGDILTTADTTIRYSQSGLFGPDLSSNWSIGLRWNF